jgi:hypothetical protein
MYTDVYLSNSHPVHNEYLPDSLRGEVFLRKEGDLSEKVWDEAGLQLWEREQNDGRLWEGRDNCPQELHGMSSRICSS